MRPLARSSIAALLAMSAACAVGDAADPSLDAGDLDGDAGDLDVDAAVDAPPDAATDAAIDAPPPALRIRRVAWRWTGCGPDELADGFGLDVTVEVQDLGVPVAIHGDLTACASFDGSPAHSACAPSLPPTGRVLAVTARRVGAASAAVDLPVVDCVGGAWDAPPDDDGDDA